MKDQIIALAKRFDADIVGFAPASRFAADDPVFKIFPETKTVIGLAFRVLRGIYRTIEEGTTYYQYTTMGVENLEEVVMPMAMINVCNYIESEGFEALPQRMNQLIRADSIGTAPEVSHRAIYKNITAETQLDFLNCAVQCGLGEESMIHSLLTRDYGPFVRCCFILTDAEIEATVLPVPSLCDRCGECIKACPGKAINPEGEKDTWRCAVYYLGANGSKNPFLPPDAYAEFKNRMDIIEGNGQFTQEEASRLLDATWFYPPAKHSYVGCICGRACDRACYIHLEEKGLLGKTFHRKFREGEDWMLSTDIFRE